MNANPIEVLGSLVTDVDGKTWAELSEPWQNDLAREFFAPDGHRFLYETAPRGASKSSGVAAVLLVAMLTEFFPRGSRSYAFATDRDQARILVDLFAGWVNRSPVLSSMFKISRFKITCKANGSTIEIIGSDSGSAYGLLSDGAIVVDEFAQMPSTANSERLWEAIMSTVLKAPTCKLVVMTTPGSPGHQSAKVWADADSSDLWWTQQVPGPLPWLNPVELEEMKRSLPRSAYARLYLGQWQTGEDALVTEADLQACLNKDVPFPLSPTDNTYYVIGLDLSASKDRTAAIVAHKMGKIVVVDDLKTWEGTAKNNVDLASVRDWVIKASRRYGSAVVYHDPWNALLLSQELVQAGVACVPVTYSPNVYARLAMTLHGTLKRHHMILPDVPAFLAELASVKIKESASGTVRIDTSPGSSQHDDMVMVLAFVTDILVSQIGGSPIFYDDDNDVIPASAKPPVLPPTPVVPAGSMGRNAGSLWHSEQWRSPASTGAGSGVFDVSHYDQ
jgi:phage terminase large subunit-like protein